jgi:hypothetical protein
MIAKERLVFKIDLRIMGRRSRPIILVERSARVPLIWGLLQPVSQLNCVPASDTLSLPPVLEDQAAGNPAASLCCLVVPRNLQAHRRCWLSEHD